MKLRSLIESQKYRSDSIVVEHYFLNQTDVGVNVIFDLIILSKWVPIVASLNFYEIRALGTVSYTHLTLPTTPYV